MRVSNQHWEAFLSIVESHPSLITSKFNGAQGKAEGNSLWIKVATKLNGLGLGEKSVAEWRRAVTDWKSKVKSKASKNRQLLAQTGGGPLDTSPLTPLEEKLLSFMGVKGVEGDQGIIELGVPVRVPVIPEYNLDFGSTEGSTNLNNNFGQAYQNVLEELVVSTEPQNKISDPLPSLNFPISAIDHNYCGKILHKTQLDIPSTSSSNQVLGPLNRDLKRQIEIPSTSSNSNQTKNKRIKVNYVPRMSKNIENMTSESIDILKNIDNNTARIADSFDKLVKYFLEKKV